MSFSILYADPPWSYADKASDGNRGAAFKYPVMSVDDIAALDVQAHMTDESVCFMWATCPCLPEALRVLDAWGYDYSTVAFTWVKTRSSYAPEARRLARRFLPGLHSRADSIVRELDDAGMIANRTHIGMGQSTRANVEIVLLGLRGKMSRQDAGVRQLVFAPLGAHSAKPPEVRDRIVRLLGDRPRLELFARDRAPGWAAWGNQVPGGNDVEITTRAAGAASTTARHDPRQLSLLGDA